MHKIVIHASLKEYIYLEIASQILWNSQAALHHQWQTRYKRANEQEEQKLTWARSKWQYCIGSIWKRRERMHYVRTWSLFLSVLSNYIPLISWLTLATWNVNLSLSASRQFIMHSKLGNWRGKLEKLKQFILRPSLKMFKHLYESWSLKVFVYQFEVRVVKVGSYLEWCFFFFC